MTKVNIGDYVCVAYLKRNGVVTGDRGGAVGRWRIELDDGTITNASTRDCVIIKSATYPARLSADEKIDMLLEHLGLEIKDQPEIIKVVKAKTDSKGIN